MKTAVRANETKKSYCCLFFIVTNKIYSKNMKNITFITVHCNNFLFYYSLLFIPYWT